MRKIKLNVVGISYSQSQSGAYALVLSEEEGDRRIPIIIGGFEAQAIAIQLEDLNPPRPLTHDLFFNYSRTFNINISEVLIYKLEEGVFYAKLFCMGPDNNEITIDSRPSDAIALALRFNCPIYTSEEILSKAGIVLEAEKEGDESSELEEMDLEKEENIVAKDYKGLTIGQLNNMLQEAINKEDYEKASDITDEINRRKK